jgi:general secretion pathway protein A
VYCQFFQVRQNPFSMTPDPEFLFLTKDHREALAGITYAVAARKGFAVLTGDAGTGKTTILATALKSLPVKQVRSSVILNPTLTTAEFLELAMLDFGFADVPASKAQRIALLQRFLLSGHRQGKVTALVIDEAHKLSPEVLEEIRLLGNFEYSDQKLLQILLLGQTELDGLLNRQDLRQFRQRIAFRLLIQPLSPGQVEQYMRHRWEKAGGSCFPFAREAAEDVASASQGIPRLINSICDNALMQAFAEGSVAVEARHVCHACSDLFLARPMKASEPAAAVLPVAATGTSELKTLHRYHSPDSTSSLLTRWAGKLRVAHRTASL